MREGKKKMNEIRIYTVEEVADILKVTKRSVYTYIKDKKIKATKIAKSWRVAHKDLEDFIAKGDAE